jgi:hypothetical protein
MISSVRALAVGQDHRAQAVEQVWERGPHGPGALTVVQRIPGGRFVLLLHRAPRRPHQPAPVQRFVLHMVVEPNAPFVSAPELEYLAMGALDAPPV